MRRWTLLCLLALMLILTGCGSKEHLFNLSEDGEPAEAGFPLHISDAGGNEVYFSGVPQQILALDSDSLNRICAVGGSAYVSACRESPKGSLHFLLTGHDWRAETEQESAELVVTGRNYTADTLPEGSKIYQSEHNTDSSISLLYVNLLPLSQAFADGSGFSKVYEFGWQICEKADAITRTIDFLDRKQVLILSEESPNRVYGAGNSWMMNDILERAGAVNACVLGGENGETIALADLADDGLQPDAVFIPYYAQYSMEDVKTDPLLSRYDAVEKGALYWIPGPVEPWYSDTPGAFPGICWTLHTLYPERYSDEEMLSDIQGYYREAYKLELTAEELGLRS